MDFVAILDYLEDCCTVSNDVAERARLEYNNTGVLSNYLRDCGVDDIELSKSLARYANREYITQETLEGMELDNNALKKLGITTIIDKGILPVTVNGDTWIVTSEPDNIHVLTSLLEQHSYTKFYVASHISVSQIIASKVKPLLAAEFSEEVASQRQINADAVRLSTASGSSSMDDLLFNIIGTAIDMGASDIQFIPTDESTAPVYFRLDGKRWFYTNVNTASIDNIYRIASNKADLPDDITAPSSGRFKVEYGKKTLYIRFSMLPVRHGLSLNLRLLSDKVYTYEDLGGSANLQEFLSEVEGLLAGLVIFTGPTGAGKSTTMQALEQRLLRRNLNICSVEDPVEVIIPGINQVEAKAPHGDKHGLSYKNILKSFLRHDPDVIIIGEIRDEDTASYAASYADTGHLVLTSLHTSDVLSTVTRMERLGVDRETLAKVLAGIVSQRLLRRVCTHCAVTEDVDANSPYTAVLQAASTLGKKTSLVKHTYGKGCPKCRSTGYLGRVLVSEHIKTSPALRKAIVSNMFIDDIREQCMVEADSTMTADIIRKVREGLTSLEEADALIRQINFFA